MKGVQADALPQVVDWVLFCFPGSPWWHKWWGGFLEFVNEGFAGRATGPLHFETLNLMISEQTGVLINGTIHGYH